jgi:hypothetical protein
MSFIFRARRIVVAVSGSLSIVGFVVFGFRTFDTGLTMLFWTSAVIGIVWLISCLILGRGDCAARRAPLSIARKRIVLAAAMSILLSCVAFACATRLPLMAIVRYHAEHLEASFDAGLIKGQRLSLAFMDFIVIYSESDVVLLGVPDGRGGEPRCGISIWKGSVPPSNTARIGVVSMRLTPISIRACWWDVTAIE